MSYRWNAHETVASGAVSDSEATRPLQTGDNAPTLPFLRRGRRGPRGRALRYPAYLCDPADFGHPFLLPRAYAHDAQDPTEVLPARSPDTRLLSNTDGSTRLMQATQTLEEPTIQASRSPHAAPRVEPATPAAPAAPVPPRAANPNVSYGEPRIPAFPTPTRPSLPLLKRATSIPRLE